MARLAGASVARAEPWRLDDEQRALFVDGERVALTRLEYGVLAHLQRRRPVVVPRDELLREVWQQAFGGSNVVDAVVRTVRRKLGRHADALETVKGFGYRLRAPDAAA
jgi:DNA-binding response OmpR family regulator